MAILLQSAYNDSSHSSINSSFYIPSYENLHDYLEVLSRTSELSLLLIVLIQKELNTRYGSTEINIIEKFKNLCNDFHNLERMRVQSKELYEK